jgi:hypothetical protein
VELLVVAVLVLAAGFWLSLHLHPYTQCEACICTGKHRGGVFRYRGVRLAGCICGALEFTRGADVLHLLMHQAAGHQTPSGSPRSPVH